MKLTRRISRLLRADAHGVMDALEDRSLLLKQHLREAELAVDRKRAWLHTLREREERLRKELEPIGREVAALDEDVELSLASDKPELARFSVARLLPRRDALERARERAAVLETERVELETQIARQEAELSELTRKVGAAIAFESERASAPEPLQAGVSDEEVELELLRRARARAGAGPASRTDRKPGGGQ